MTHFFFISDDFGSDHSSTITTLNIVTQSRLDLKAKINFKKFNQIVRQEYENQSIHQSILQSIHQSIHQLYPPVYPIAEEISRLNEVLVHIIEFLLQESYIIQEILPFGYETTKLIREKKKKRRELKRINGEQLNFLKKEKNFLQREIKKSMKRSKKSNNQN